jgi:hypothetical protein
MPTTVPLTFSELYRTRLGGEGEMRVRRAKERRLCRATLAASIVKVLRWTRALRGSYREVVVLVER